MPSVLFVGGTPESRNAAAAARLASAANVIALDAASLPFLRPSVAIATGGATLQLADVDRAFPNRQVGGTRLILTQSTYTLQKWLDLLGPSGAIVATAERAALERGAAEAWQARGPWAQFEIVDLSRATPKTADDVAEISVARVAASAVASLLAQGYGSASADERVDACRRAADLDGTGEVAQLALASALRETNDMEGARAALDRALALAPDWEAAHYEDGKFWLGYDDMARARDAFQRAADRMPSFAAAFSNLGATLGELDDAAGALAAFQQALRHDPYSFQALNNVGVASREAGRLEESAAAFHRVIELAPQFVFGYYNLGHTLFLAGRYPEALTAYEEGQRRDPEKNRRQGCRLAMMRLATGDAAGAERDLWRFANAAPPDERQDLLVEAHEIASALLAAHPDLASARPLLDRIAAGIGQ